MTAVSIMNRGQQKLGDFLFPPEQQRFNLEENKNQASRVNSFNITPSSDLVKQFLGENVFYAPTATLDNEGVNNKNYEKERKRETLDNQAFCKNISYKNISSNKSTKSSKRSKTKKNAVKDSKKIEKKDHLNQTRIISPTMMETDDESDEDRLRNMRLQQEIEREQEYQNQMNMIYNNPQYFQQYSHHLQYQPALHHPQQDSVTNTLVIQAGVIQPMYYVPLPPATQQQPPHFDKKIFQFSPSKIFDTVAEETSSDYFSDSASCSDCSEDEISSEMSSFDIASSFDFSAFNLPATTREYEDYQEYDGDVPLELDEELNKLVLSIISD